MKCDEHLIYKATNTDIESIVNFIDTYYRKDYFLPKSKVVRMVTGEVDPKFGNNRKPLNVWISRDKNGISGVAFVTLSKTLIQLLVRPDCRKIGVGSKLIEFSCPEHIRCKIDTSTGDPTGFYYNNGFLEYQSTIDGNKAICGKNNNILILHKSKTKPGGGDAR